MSYSPFTYSSDIPTNAFLHVNNCATLLLNDKDYHIERPKGRSDYLLIYLARGKGHVIIDGKDHIVEEKQAFIFHPNEPQSYHFYKKDNTVNYWIHFNGTSCKSIINSLGLNGINILKLNIDTLDIEQMLQRLCHEFSQKNPFYDQICSGLLITILGLVSRSVHNSNLPKRKATNLVEQLIGEFRANPQFSFAVEDLAEKFSISKNHLIREFKKSTGKTPAQYMIDNRIEKAKELLLFSNYNIIEISEFLGYQSYSYFSRIFKKHVGVSPADFRARKNLYDDEDIKPL